MKMLIVNLLIFVSPFVWAADENISTIRQENMNAKDTGPVGFAPFIGLGAGFTPKNDVINVEGANSNIRLLGSFYPENQKSVFDLGFGALNQTFSSDLVPERAETGGILEYAGRYQWSNRWQAGLVGNTILGRGAYYGANQADAQFAGLQVIREITLEKGRLARIGARAMQDLNVNKENIYMGMIDFQFGFGGYHRQEVAVSNPADSMISPQTDTTQVTGATTTLAEVAPMAEPVAEMNLKELVGNQAVITFSSNSTKLNSSEKEKVQDLGALLSEHQNLFETVEVVGFTDNTGHDEANMNISVERAAQVASILEQQGLSAKNIQLIGKGSSSPFAEGTSTHDQQMNRRVEIRLLGVRDRNELENALQSE